MKTILVDAWNTIVTENGINQEMYQLLESFQNQKIILTNANREECEKFGIINMPYEVFSCDHNPDKSNPQYYANMLEKYHLGSEEVIYFEHNPVNVESAQSYGIKTFWYNKEMKDIEGLRQFLKDNL